MTAPFNLEDHGITVAEIHRNIPPSALYEHAMRYEKGTNIAENGALVAYSGVKTGRSPKDKRIVKHPDSEADVWWGTVNIPIQPVTFAINRERARDYLKVFGFDVVTECPNVPAEILIPLNVWTDKAAFDAMAKKLAGLFIKNFAAYEGGVSAEVKAGGPVAPV
jgi:ATP-dependent phosphoenolpyruvate carboxykinase